MLTRLAALNLVDAGDEGLAERVRGRAGQRDRPGRPPGGRGRVAGRAADLPRAPRRARPPACRRSTCSDNRDPLLGRVVLAHRAWVGTELGAPVGAGLGRDGRATRSTTACCWRRRTGAAPTRSAPACSSPPTTRRPARRSPGCARWRWRAARCGCASRPSGTRPTTRCAPVASPRPRTTRGSRSTSSTTTTNVFTGGAAEMLVSALAERGAFGEARELLRERRLDGALRDRGVGDRPAPRPGPAVARRGRLRARLRRGDGGGRAARRAGPAEPGARALALDRGPRPGAPRPARGGGGAGRRRARAGGALRRARRRSPPRCTPAPSPSPTTRRGSSCASAAWTVADRAPGLESVRLRLELGSALASLGRRVEARDALRPALADADAAGAVNCWPSGPGASSWRRACGPATRRSRAPPR